MTANELRDVLRENIRTKRMDCRMTQRALAQAVGVAQPTIAQIESGTTTPTIETVAKIADALKVSPDLLFRPRIFSGLTT